MISQKSNACFCIGLAFAGLLPAACTSLAEAYRGRVVDEQGRPLEGVTVKEIHGQRSVVTNAAGYFRLEKAPETIDDLVFDKKGYRRDTIPTVFTHAGESIDYQFLREDTTEVTLRPLSTAP